MQTLFDLLSRSGPTSASSGPLLASAKLAQIREGRSAPGLGVPPRIGPEEWSKRAKGHVAFWREAVSATSGLQPSEADALLRKARESRQGVTEPGSIWTPQPGSQELFLQCPLFECSLFGTRGPGKTDAALADFAQHVGQGFGEAWRGLIFRREYKHLADLVAKSKKWFPRIFPEARWLESQASYKWVWPDGEELFFRTFGIGEKDYWNYHGHEYPWICFEELGTWPDLKGYDLMKSVCRSSDPRVPRKFRSTGNPWGAGHNAVKRRMVDPAPPGSIITDDEGKQRACLFGWIWENRFLVENDPEYLATLRGDSNEQRRKAWLSLSWDVASGGMFDALWDEGVHVVEPFEIPPSWRLDRSFDWGSSRPFSVGWWAESDGTQAPNGKIYAKGTLFRIAEWYGCEKDGRGDWVPDTGLRMLATEIAAGIRAREARMGLKVHPGPADRNIWAEENGTSIAASFKSAGVDWTKADQSAGSRKARWEAVNEFLKASLQTPMEKPGLFTFSNCRAFIDLFPRMPRSEKDPDDLDTDAEDHIADEAGYRVAAAGKSDKFAIY